MLKISKMKAQEKNKKVEERLKELMEENALAVVKEQKSQWQVIQPENPGIEFDQEENTFDQIKKKAQEMGREYSILDAESRLNLLTLKDQRTGRTSIVDVMLPSERLKQRAFLKPEEKSGSDQKAETKDKQIQNLGEDSLQGKNPKEEAAKILPVPEQADIVEVASTMSDVMKMFRERGMLDRKKTTTYVGRAKDTKFLDEMDRVGAANNDRIKLEYRDKVSGRLFTQKEAFNDMCRQFHNIKKSKKKQMKMMKKQKAMDHARFSDPLQSKSYMLMRAMQEQTGQAHVDLNKATKK